MKNNNLYLRFSQVAFRHVADKPFLITPGRENLNYKDLDSACGRLQSRLLELNVLVGDRIMVQVEKSPEAVILYLACLRIGAIYIPLNNAYTANELEYFIVNAEPKVLICEPKAFKNVASIARQHKIAHVKTLASNGHGSLTENLSQLDCNPPIANRDSDDLAAILYTSGTTGRSKGAMLSHANLQSNAEVLHKTWHWDNQNDVLLHALPIFHVHGLFVALHCALLGGSTVHFLAKFNSEQIIKLLPRSTVMMGVPTFYIRLLDSELFQRNICKNMRLFISGSAPLLEATHRKFEHRTGHRILERYGMTETGITTSNSYRGERIQGKVGFPLSGVSVRVVDDKGTELAPNEAGVLETIGENVFKGYWRMPDKTKQEFRSDGWFITGDLASIDGLGCVSIVGRAKDIVISGGYNIYPKEIESEIDGLEGVNESAVVGVPHPDFGEAAIAVVVLDGGQVITEQDIMDALQDRLARFKMPKRVFFLNKLPRNTMAKVQKKQLCDNYQDTFA